jgi:hypothetical protein
MNNEDSKAPEAASGLNDGLGMSLALAVKDWWEEHKYDTSGSWNVYDFDPPFVEIAKKMIGDWEKVEGENDDA